MTYTDLMVGDYVTLSANTNARMQVVFIMPRINIIELADIDNHGTIENYPIEALCGIPLTPEILEKNGFESDNNIFGYASYELSDEFILENRGERFCITKIMYGRKSSTFFIVDIHFVHELQHALRFCGIDKKIVL